MQRGDRSPVVERGATLQLCRVGTVLQLCREGAALQLCGAGTVLQLWSAEAVLQLCGTGRSPIVEPRLLTAVVSLVAELRLQYLWHEGLIAGNTFLISHLYSPC